MAEARDRDEQATRGRRGEVRQRMWWGHHGTAVTPAATQAISHPATRWLSKPPRNQAWQAPRHLEVFLRQCQPLQPRPHLWGVVPHAFLHAADLHTATPQHSTARISLESHTKHLTRNA
jgi:hypothetical protein